MYKIETNTYVCDTCGFEGPFDVHDDINGCLWECEKCGKHFCSKCGRDALTSNVFTYSIRNFKDVLCPDCFKKAVSASLEALLEIISERFDCNTRLESDGKTVLIQIASPEGQDVGCEIEPKGENDAEKVKCLREELREYSDAFDPDEEAAYWIGPDGHGKYGAPYRLCDLLKDMEWAEKFWGDVATFVEEVTVDVQ